MLHIINNGLTECLDNLISLTQLSKDSPCLRACSAFDSQQMAASANSRIWRTSFSSPICSLKKQTTSNINLFISLPLNHLEETYLDMKGPDLSGTKMGKQELIGANIHSICALDYKVAI